MALVIGDVRDPIVYDGAVDYIIHGASVTASKEMVTRPVETIATAIGGTEQILRFAVAKQVTSMVYISSMEMYGTPALRHRVRLRTGGCAPGAQLLPGGEADV